mgnify:CR=1 FL=1
MSKSKTILKSTTAVITVMLASKLLGFLRQTLMANIYGSNDLTDIYFISSEFMINVVGAFTTALTTALVTVYISIAVKNGKKAAGEVVSKVLVLFLVAATAAILILDSFAPQVGRLLAPAYDTEQLNLLARYLRIFSAAFIFSAFQSIYAAVLNANDIFVPGKLYGLIYNPLVIAFILLLNGKLGIDSVICAYYIANIIQIIFLHLRCRGIYSFRPTLNLRDERLVQVGRLALPILLSNVVIQLNGIIDKALCSYLGEGVASAYTYAYTLEQFVTGTFTATITMVLLSQFANLVAEKDFEKINAMLTRAVSAMILTLTPVAVITVLSARDIVTLIYMRGKFTMEAVDQTTMALIGFAVGFPIIALREVMIRIHFAFQKTQLPVAISILSVLLNAVASILLSQYIGILGITIATSVSAVASVVLLVITSRRYVPDFHFFSCWKAMLKCAVALLFGAAAVLLAGWLFPDHLLLRIIFRLSMGCIVYAAALYALRCQELLELLGAIRARLRPTR